MAAPALPPKAERRVRKADHELSNAWVELTNALDGNESATAWRDLVEAQRYVDQARDLIRRHFPLK